MAPGANPVLITRYENGAVGTLAGHRYRKLNIISFTLSANTGSTAPSTTRTSSNGSRRAFPIRSAAT